MLTRREAYNTVNFMLQYYGCLYSTFHYYITSASLYIFEKKIKEQSTTAKRSQDSRSGSLCVGDISPSHFLSFTISDKSDTRFCQAATGWTRQTLSSVQTSIPRPAAVQSSTKPPGYSISPVTVQKLYILLYIYQGSVQSQFYSTKHLCGVPLPTLQVFIYTEHTTSIQLR